MYHDFINNKIDNMPDYDNPKLFGLHINTSYTFQKNESKSFFLI